MLNLSDKIRPVLVFMSASLKNLWKIMSVKVNINYPNSKCAAKESAKYLMLIYIVSHELLMWRLMVKININIKLGMFYLCFSMLLMCLHGMKPVL